MPMLLWFVKLLLFSVILVFCRFLNEGGVCKLQNKNDILNLQFIVINTELDY